MNELKLCKKPFICLIRHGQTEAAKAGRLNGLAEVQLTELGERQAASLKEPLAAIAWDVVLSSPLQRVRLTAQLAGFSNPEIVQDLQEFDCGDYEGLTTVEVRANRPGWDFWRDGCVGGETPENAAVRVDRVLSRLKEGAGATLVFSHAGTIRIMVARYLGLQGHMGSAFGFDPAHIGVISIRNGYPAIIFWNYGEHLPLALKEPEAASVLPH